ncbi:MAG: cytochrome c biogenesis CcdA family protein [Candidatus Melainabacteria bacterium]
MPGLETQLLAQLHAESGTVLLLGFLGGVLSSLLPCSVGMLPVLIGYVGGFGELSRWGILRQVLLFMVGVSLVLTVLGVLASSIGFAFGSLVGEGWYWVVGITAILMGLQLLGWITLPLPPGLTRLPATPAGRWLSPLILGLAFGAATSPCGTPFLTVILGFISQQKNILLGGAALFAYGLGQSILLLLVGLGTGLIRHLAVLRRVGHVINTLSAVVFILAGALLIAQGAGWLDPLAFFP